jgi:transposase
MTPQTLNANQIQYNHIVAFEVSKAKLFVHVLPEARTTEIDNTPAMIRRLIKKEKLRNAKLGLGPLLVVCEATGTYSNAVLACADELAVACHRAHGSRVRAFARFRGTLAKSDPIDVAGIADYARCSRELVLHSQPRAAQVELRELVARRTEMRQMKEAEEARVEHVASQVVRDSLRALIATLEKLFAKIEARIAALMAQDETFAERARLMQSVKGVGPVTAASLLAYLPELGAVSRATIAALAGLAPYDADSGLKKGQRHIFGGRAEVRTSLYMAALVAIRHNPHLRAMGERVVARGNPFKVAVTAVMRKLLVMLNAIVASGQPCKMKNAT